MHLVRDRISLTSTGATSIVAYTEHVFNGTLYAIGYTTGAGAPPTTSAVTVEGARWGVDILTSVALAASFVKFPRELTVETSGASTQGIYPTEAFPLVDERIQITLVGCTSALTEGSYLDFWVEGA